MKKLIFDIGMNDGRDTLFYLKKGFRVVSVEASPILAQQVAETGKEWVDSGDLKILNVGIGEQPGNFPFYKNLDNDHWSSFDREWGTRQGTSFEVLDIECITPQTMIERYGMPYYMKIDVEGADIACARGLRDFKSRPRFLSMEEHETEYFAELWGLGARDFKLVNQRDLGLVECPNPPLEGLYVDQSFDGFSSGPFGEESPGEWKGFSDVLHEYLTKIRSPLDGYLAGHSWFDIHCRFDVSLSDF